ncbi:NAD(P)/FAD-dependent oxidoreductase [Thalassolituus sp.]|uniref:NAD(P)/FAD-dependent oxidoreductase n=1 Tax=Thalassolituus sp. TaxID=2030822 RepID=UPI002A81202D|nr:FAD-dependent oxidoreductase [Thalassolituus sp.]
MTDNVLVIIGNGMASNRLLEELGPDHPYTQIHVLSDEPIAHYNRIMLSPLLANETTLEAITPHDATWYKQHRIAIHLDHSVASINKTAKKVTCNNGNTFSYHALVFATGSRSSIPALEGIDNPAVIGFRSMTDVDAMTARLHHLEHATVIGAGLLGVEAAVGLRSRGVRVTLMHRNSVLMNRQLDETASKLLEHELIARGIEVITGANPQRLVSTPNGDLNAVELIKDGVLLTTPTQLVVFATGIIPNTELATSAGILTGRGICVNSMMETSESDVYSLGECSEFDGTTYGLVAPIWDQAKVLARRLKAEDTNKSTLIDYIERTHLTKLKVSGLDVHSIGEFDATDDCEILDLKDLVDGVYKKLVIRNNRIIGVLCVGDVADSHWYFELMFEDIDISAIRGQLILGQAYCEAA